MIRRGPQRWNWMLFRVVVLVNRLLVPLVNLDRNVATVIARHLMVKLLLNLV